MYTYINHSQANLKESNFGKFLYSIPIIFKDAFLNNINFDLVLYKLKKLISYDFLKKLDAIYVGQFEHLNSENLLAQYSDNTIYINNNQPSNDKLILALIHEIGHLVENDFAYDIYGDQLVKNEFLAKRKILYQKLKQKYEVLDSKLFQNIEYNKQFDDYLYKIIGYDTLLVNFSNVFVSPYSITSLSEYYSIGFEKFFGKNTDEVLNLKSLCPQLYKKLERIQYIIESED